MKACVIHAAHDLRVEERDADALGADEVRVKLGAGGICGTDLHYFHEGGIGDFPNARVHVFADELAAAKARSSVKEKNRYIEAQWAHDPNWVEHRVAGESWLGFESVQVIGEDVLIVPLRGHTRGHSGIAVRRPSGGWYLHGYFS